MKSVIALGLLLLSAPVLAECDPELRSSDHISDVRAKLACLVHENATLRSDLTATSKEVRLSWTTRPVSYLDVSEEKCKNNAVEAVSQLGGSLVEFGYFSLDLKLNGFAIGVICPSNLDNRAQVIVGSPDAQRGLELAQSLSNLIFPSVEHGITIANPSNTAVPLQFWGDNCIEIQNVTILPKVEMHLGCANSSSFRIKLGSTLRDGSVLFQVYYLDAEHRYEIGAGFGLWILVEK